MGAGSATAGLGAGYRGTSWGMVPPSGRHTPLAFVAPERVRRQRAGARASDIDPAGHQAQQAVELAGSQLQAGAQPGAQVGQQRLARPLQPAQRGRAVDAGQGAQLLEAQPVDVTLPEQVLIGGRQRGQTFAQGRRKGRPVAGLQERQLAVAPVVQALGQLASSVATSCTPRPAFSASRTAAVRTHRRRLPTPA